MDFLGSLMGAVGLSSQYIDELGSAWPGLYATLNASMDQGIDPQTLEVKTAASTLVELIQKATGKKLQSQVDLQDLLTQYGPLLKRYLGDKVPDGKLIEYIAKAAGLL